MIGICFVGCFWWWISWFVVAGCGFVMVIGFAMCFVWFVVGLLFVEFGVWVLVLLITCCDVVICGCYWI